MLVQKRGQFLGKHFRGASSISVWRDFGEIAAGPGLLRSTFSGGTDNKATEALTVKFFDVCPHAMR